MLSRTALQEQVWYVTRSMLTQPRHQHYAPMIMPNLCKFFEEHSIHSVIMALKGDLGKQLVYKYGTLLLFSLWVDCYDGEQ